MFSKRCSALFKTDRRVDKGSDQWILTQLDVADPHALFALFKNLLKVNTSKPTGAARHQNSCQANKLRARRGGLLWVHRGLRGPL